MFQCTLETAGGGGGGGDGPPRSEQASGVWVEVGNSEEIIKRQLLLHPSTPLES